MKRFFFSLIALAAVAASCTQSALVETPDLNGTEITFNPYTGRTPVTKAQSIEGAGGQQDVYGLAEAGGFQILGFLTQKVDNADKVSLYMDKRVEGVMKSVNGQSRLVWEYSDNIFWPDESTHETTTLSFVAYSYNAMDHIDWTPGKKNEEFTFTVPEVVSDQVDLLATNYQTKLSLDSNSSGIVELEFGHLLSRVGFKAQATKNNGNVTIVIKNLALSGTMPTQGVINLKSAVNEFGKNKDIRPSWDDKITPTPTADNPDSKTTYAILTSEKGVAASHDTPQRIANGSNEFMMIMPHQSSNAEIQITYYLSSTDRGDSQEIKAIVPLGAFEFKQGTAYEFILQFSTSSIGFDVVETPWNNADQSEGMKPDYPINPEPAEHIDLGASVKSASSATIATYVNVSTFETLQLQYKPAVKDSEWTDEEDGNIVSLSYNKNEIGGPYNYTLENLNPNTKYQYRIIASGEDGTEYSATKTFITLADLTTEDATEVESFTAVLNAKWGETNGNANLQEIGFVWSTTNLEPTNRLYDGIEKHATKENNMYSYKMQSTNNPGTEENPYFYLEPNTKYYFRAYCKNEDGGVSYGDVKNFTTTIALETPDSGNDEGVTNPPEEGDNPDEKEDPIDPWDEPTDDEHDIEF